MLANLTTTIVKVFDRNPFFITGIVLAIAFSTYATGCSLAGKSVDPTTGEEATAETIRYNAQAKLDELQKNRESIIAQMGTLQLSLGALSEEEDVVVERSNAAIEAANLETERNKAIVESLVNVLGSQVPGLGPGILGVASMIGLGGLGLDRIRVNGVVKRMRKENGDQ